MKKIVFIVFLMFSTTVFAAPIHYRINAKLNVETKTLKGSETITFTNIYRNGLKDMYIHLFPNAFKPGSRMDKEKQKSGDYSIAFASPKNRGFLNITHIKCSDPIIKTENEGDEYHILFSKPMNLNDTISIDIDFFEKIPKFYMREGYKKNHFELTQWYPKIAMYDKKGWHHEGYNDIGEFYSEFADYDVRITLPVNFITGATGALMGPDGEMERMKKLSGEHQVQPPSETEKCVYYKAKNVTDFAFVADPNFVMDNFKYMGVDIKILKKRSDLKEWDSAGIYVKRAINFYSDKVGPYPYKHLTVVDGNISAGSGMEYPELIIIGSMKGGMFRIMPGKKRGMVSERVIGHETGHQWFYASLATDEFNEPFMDESINSYFENKFMEKYGHFPKKLAKNKAFLSFYNPLLIAAVPYYARIYYPMNVSSAYFDRTDDNIQYGAAIYSEGPLIMREIANIMGQKNFNDFIHAYYKKYAFKHPHIDNFVALAYKFTTKKNADFIKSLFYKPIKCDLSFSGFQKMPDDSLFVKINKRNYYPAVPVTFLYKDTSITVYSPSGTGIRKIAIPRKTGLDNIVINKNEYIFEVNRMNNYWKNYPQIKLFASMPSFDHYQIFLGPYAWYDSRNGIIAGLWLEGRDFVNYDFLQGRNQWHLGFNWQFGNMHPEYIFAYSTPLIPGKNYLKLILNSDIYDYTYTSQIALEKKFAGNFNINLLSKQYLIGKIILTYKDISKVDSNYLDPLDNQAGKMSSVRFVFTGKNRYKYMDIKFTDNVQFGKKGILSDYNIIRGWSTVNMEFGGLKRFVGIDLFAGAGNGDLPTNYKYDMASDMLSNGFDGKHIKALSGLSGRLSILLPMVNPYIAAGYIMAPSAKAGVYYTAGIKIDLKALTIDVPVFYKSPDMASFGHRIDFIFNALGLRIGSISL